MTRDVRDRAAQWLSQFSDRRGNNQPEAEDLVRELLASLAAVQEECARLRAEQERLFPIQGGPAIPWSVIAPCEHQAQQNHSQTLERLAERGGLSPLEALDVLLGRDWTGRTFQLPAERAEHAKANAVAIQQMLAIVKARQSNPRAEKAEEECARLKAENQTLRARAIIAEQHKTLSLLGK